MKRLTLPLIALAAVAGMLWRYPPIHIVRLADAEAAKAGQAFDAEAFVDKLWSERLTPALAEAHDARAVVAAIGKDSQAARESYGRSVGLSRGYFYFLSGDGAIVSVEKNKIGVALEDGKEEAAVVLATGPIFGNAVRDATGLVTASDFPNSQDFNAISAALNRRVESQIIPSLVADAKVGRRLHFVGCVEVRSEPGDLQPLKAVPLAVRFEP